MDSQFDVVFTGELKPGIERDDVISAFSQRFQCNEAKAIEVVNAGRPVTMKSAVSLEIAEQFRNVLEAMGMTIRLEPVSSIPPTTQTTSPESTSTPDTTNPYQAPQANLSEGHASDEMTGPVSVPFGHGASWLGTAFSHHFKTNALAWIGTFLVLAILSIVLQVIPLIGPIAYILLSPVFTGGIMLGAKAQDNGEDFTVGHLFSAFNQSAGQLMLIGLLYMIGMFTVFFILFAVMGSSISMLDAGDPAAAEAMMNNPMTAILSGAIMLLLFTPLLMAYWFAPALVAIDGISALGALKLSFIGCLKNVLPFLLYGVLVLLLMFVAAIPLFLGYLILFPVMMASMYTAYRDIYFHEA